MRPISEREFAQLVNFMKTNYGVDLTHKKSLVVGRLQNYIARNNFGSLAAYLKYVQEDRTGAALDTLVNKLTTNHTYFMREADHFVYFRDLVLPYLVEKERENKDLRIWSAGCATGEEAYTLAMTIADFFGAEKETWDTKILATDISTKALEKAVQGIYSNDKLRLVPPPWRRKYFLKIDQQRSAVVDTIKREVIFRRFNLMEKVFPFKKKFHVIFCRNVMIYFAAKTQTELANRFYDALESGGYLFIGQAEFLNREETKFRYLNPGVYRKE